VVKHLPRRVQHLHHLHPQLLPPPHHLVTDTAAASINITSVCESTEGSGSCCSDKRHAYASSGSPGVDVTPFAAILRHFCSSVISRRETKKYRQKSFSGWGSDMDTARGNYSTLQIPLLEGRARWAVPSNTTTHVIGPLCETTKPSLPHLLLFHISHGTTQGKQV